MRRISDTEEEPNSVVDAVVGVVTVSLLGLVIVEPVICVDCDWNVVEKRSSVDETLVVRAEVDICVVVVCIDILGESEVEVNVCV